MAATTCRATATAVRWTRPRRPSGSGRGCPIAAPPPTRPARRPWRSEGWHPARDAPWRRDARGSGCLGLLALGPFLDRPVADVGLEHAVLEVLRLDHGLGHG